MTPGALKQLKNCFEELNIPYSFMQWSKKVTFPYCIGEYTEVASPNECGKEESIFMLTATTDGSFLELENIKEKVKDYFTNEGREFLLDNSALSVCYENAFPVDTGESGFKRMQINLNIKEWKGKK